MTDCFTRKSLQEIELPKNVRLVEPALRQRVMRGLVVRTFTLVYEGDKSLGPVEHEEVYELGIADIAQVAYALRKLFEKVDILKGIAEQMKPTRVEVAKSGFGAAVAKFEAEFGLTA